jgi:hypothetical protein
VHLAACKLRILEAYEQLDKAGKGRCCAARPERLAALRVAQAARKGRWPRSAKACGTAARRQTRAIALLQLAGQLRYRTCNVAAGRATTSKELVAAMKKGRT